MSFSTENFEIPPKYVDPNELQLPRVVVGHDLQVDNRIEQFLYGFLIVVVILFVATLVVAIVGWLGSFSQLPPHQQLTERIQHVQEAVRGTISTASNGGGGRAASPSPKQQPGTSSGRAEEAAQNQVVRPVEEKDEGASAPSVFKGQRDRLEHHWSCFKSGDGRIVCRTTVDGQFVFRELVDGALDCQLKEQGESNADTKPMAHGVVDYAGEFPADGSLSRGGPDWLSRKDFVYGAEVPSRCSGVRFRIPAGRTASLYRAETGRASLDTRYGPAALVLQEGYCMDTGSVHVCVVCGSSN